MLSQRKKRENKIIQIRRVCIFKKTMNENPKEKKFGRDGAEAKLKSGFAVLAEMRWHIYVSMYYLYIK